MKILDVGCGNNKFPSAYGIDMRPNTDADLRGDFTDGNAVDTLLAINSEWDEVLIRHCLEHIALPEIAIRNSRKLLTKGGMLIIIVPYAMSIEGLYPGHVSFFTEHWFQRNITFNELFGIVNIDYVQSPLSNDTDWMKAKTHLFNMCCEMTIIARAK